MAVDKHTFEEVGREARKSTFIHKNIAIDRKGWRFLRYRLLRPFLKRRYWRYQRLNPQTPWITPPIVFALEKLLNKDMIGYEFGSGRSTRFYAERMKHIYAIEHDEAWYKKVLEDLESQQIDNADLKLIVSEKKMEYPQISSEDHIDLSADNYPVKDDLFSTYVNSLDAYEDEHFDFIAVDGRARLSCALRGIKKLKTGGILMLDNSERKRYSAVHEALKDWPQIMGTTGLTDTTIWLKPA